ncbi:MAG: hypothetical protein HRT51_17515 [Colwellia sp.]|nr:hypothetical protein [Colwellia sp.]
MKTSAKKVDGGYLIKGNKLEKLGIHSQDTSELFFEDVFVADSALLGSLNTGFIALMK